MVVVGITGSPRRKGNTEMLVSGVLTGVTETGGEVIPFSVADGDIGGCTGCMRCRRVPRCSIDDRMTLIYEAVMRADAVVFGSPVYMGQMSAQAKAVVDRLYALVNNDGSPRFKHGTILLPLFTQGQAEPGRFSTYFDLCDELFTQLGFEVMAPLVAGGVRMKGEIGSQKALLASAREMGKKLGNR
ncbi:flavodoxin family protein [Desulfoluna spongiiphila]|uniref:flavodoxin family protein n=1 Tax=Desulfoluna spongiiphila TaxID=419481 RepID=UPI001259D938|nr:flavodoxin family protein [Desulfoluna spongiiphila]VVS93908.1 nadph-dependent fmn reductase-like [Desulfoluna spongiiphila]